MRRAFAALGAAGVLAAMLGGATSAAPAGGNGKLALHSDSSGNSEIYLADLDGSGAVNLTNNPARDVSPTWSPNGTKLAFASDRGGISRIYTLNPPTKQVAPLTASGSDAQTNPYWCTDTKIVFAAGGDIFVGDTTNGGSVNLTNTPDAVESQPACSPAGELVIFHSTRSDAGRTIWDMRLGGGAQRQLTPSGWTALDADIRPDGNAFLFFGRSPDGQTGLWENRYKLTASVAWSPKKLISVTPPRELRLSRYAPDVPYAWSPRFKSTIGSLIFGTDLPQGSAGPSDTRSLFRYRTSSREFRTVDLVRLARERANPVVQPLPYAWALGSNLGLRGTHGADVLNLRLGRDYASTKPAKNFFVFDANRSVIRGGGGIYYDRAFSKIFASTLSGNDKVTITGSPPAKTKFFFDCGAGKDEVTLNFPPIKLDYETQGCEKVKR